MKNILILSVFLLSISCGTTHSDEYATGRQLPPEREESRYIMSEMKFETDAELSSGVYRQPWVSRWITVTGNQQKDSKTFAEGKYSLRMDNSGNVYYYLDASRIEGDSLTFSGKYKYKKADGGKIFFYILQKDRYESIEWPPIPDSLIVNGMKGDAEWNSFTIKAKLKDDIQEIRFGLNTENIQTVWIDDWDIQVDDLPVYRFVKTHYPAEDDKEFDNGSKISLGELTPTKQHNLEVLARVWGFLKYYHPNIIDGDINWDYELFRILPEVAAANNKKSLNKILSKWIDKYGDFPVKTYNITNEKLYSSLIDNSWINDEEVFTREMIEKLNKVEKGVRSNKVNYYVIPFGGGARDRNFRAEKPYGNIQWDDQGFRLLTLFRFWNVMEYIFPYKYLTDTPWDTVLSNYLPSIYSPATETDYYANIVKLVAEIDDSHGGVYNLSPSGTPAERFYLPRYPAEITETPAGDFCVYASYTSELKTGDVILSIEGKPVREIYEEMVPYTTASNQGVLSRNIRSSFLSSKNKAPLNIAINRNGDTIALTLKQYDPEANVFSGIKQMNEYAEKNKDILFFNVGRGVSVEMADKIKKNMSAKGIIFDLRQYPRDFMSFFKLSDVLLPDSTINLWFSSPDLAYVGNYKKYNECPIGFKNPDYYKGKVAILVNENTQSLGEMTAIALAYAPNAKVIGSTTSGADGNVTSFVLPGGMICRYTVLGAYYPNWGQCQRTGVKIDIQVRPTVEDLRSKKDVLIEKAIEYIRQ